MCDMGISESIAIAGLVMSAAATATAAYASYENQKSQNAANDYNAAMLRRNAEVTDLQAQQTVEQGKVEEEAQRKKVQAVIGSQRAAASSSGLLVDSGTTQAVTEDTAGFGELDALTIRSNAQRAAWGIKNQGADYTAQSNLVSMKNSSPVMAAAPSLLAGGSSLAKGIYGYNQEFGRPSSVRAQPAYS